MRIDPLAESMKGSVTDHAIEPIGGERSTIRGQPESVRRFGVKQKGTVVVNVTINTRRALIWEDGQMHTAGLCLLCRNVDAPGGAILDNDSTNFLSRGIGEAEGVGSQESDDQAIAK